jgi:hypothetical protein
MAFGHHCAQEKKMTNTCLLNITHLFEFHLRHSSKIQGFKTGIDENKRRRVYVHKLNQYVMLRKSRRLNTCNYIHMKNIRCLNLLDGYI